MYGVIWKFFRTLNHATYDVYSANNVKMLVHKKFYEYSTLYLLQNILTFCVIEVLDSKQILSAIALNFLIDCKIFHKYFARRDLNAFEALMHGKCYRYCLHLYVTFFIVFVCKIYIFYFYEKVALKANVKYTMKRCIMSAMECTDVAASTFTAT